MRTHPEAAAIRSGTSVVAIGWRETEVEALVTVRELVGKGWPVEVLSLMVEDNGASIEALLPAVTGAELVRRAEDAAGDRRLTA